MLLDLYPDIPDITLYSSPAGLLTPTSPIYKEHLPVHLMPGDVTQCKVIYLTRDPRDVVVSYQHHMTLFKTDAYKGTLSNMVDLFCSG